MEDQIDQLISECQQQHREALEEIEKWHAARLRSEGAIMALRSLKQRSCNNGHDDIAADMQQPIGPQSEEQQRAN